MSWTALHPDAVAGEVAERLATSPGRLRVAVDGPPAADPDGFAAGLVPLLERSGRSVAHVRAATFWRDASLRFEHGREDVESYLTGWLDGRALQREVLARVAVDGEYLPSLRDPDSNRSTREAPRPLPAQGIVLVSGALLLGRDLSFDRTVHLHLSPGALARRTPAEQAWTLPAHAQYDAAVRPVDAADVVIKLDDPRHPALRNRS